MTVVTGFECSQSSFEEFQVVVRSRTTAKEYKVLILRSLEKMYTHTTDGWTHRKVADNLRLPSLMKEKA